MQHGTINRRFLPDVPRFAGRPSRADEYDPIPRFADGTPVPFEEKSVSWAWGCETPRAKKGDKAVTKRISNKVVEKMYEMQDQGADKTDIAAALSVSESTVYKYLKDRPQAKPSLNGNTTPAPKPKPTEKIKQALAKVEPPKSYTPPAVSREIDLKISQAPAAPADGPMEQLNALVNTLRELKGNDGVHIAGSINISLSIEVPL